MIRTSHLVLAGAVIVATLLAMVYMSLDREVVLPSEPAAAPATLTATPPASPPPVAETSGGIIEVPVRLRDWETDQHIALGTVEVRDLRGHEVSTKLVDGDIRLPVNVDGPWCFKFSVPGYESLAWCFLDYLDVARGVATQRVDIYLKHVQQPKGDFRMTVQDGATGDSIADAAISVLEIPAPGAQIPEGLTPVATTNSGGHAWITGRTPRLFLVSKEPYASAVVRYKPNTETVVKLYMLTGVQGRLLDNGVPAAGKLAPELLVDERASILVTAPQTLQPDGSFKWTDLAPGLYAMRILRENGETWGTFPVTVTDSVVTEVSPDLKDFGQLEGLASLLAPGRTIHAELALVTAPETPLYRVPVDETGQFTFGRVPADTYLVRLVDEDGNERHITHPVTAGEIRNIRLAAPPASEKRP